MRFGSLFSGIGGIDLGLERAGMQAVWQSEIDPYCSRVLAKHWPDVPNLGDITTIDWSSVEPVDLICGGYPCQPFSLAGARNGTADPRHLWPYFADAIRHLRPRWALLENVPGHLSLGFGRVHADLAALGYDTDWDCIPAAAVGAPHLRYRIFVVAHTSSPERGRGTQRGQSRNGEPGVHGAEGTAAHTDGQSQPGHPVDAFTRPGLMVPDPHGDRVRQQPVGLTRGRGPSVAVDDREEMADASSIAEREPPNEAHTLTDQRNARPIAGGGDWWAVEPDVGRVANGIPARMDRLRALGNAVVPQVAEHIGRLILEATA
jgi:DNA (cytosine-5)-methyltransferase 1